MIFKLYKKTTINNTVIPAKVLLFGEYITLIGGTAVARPLPTFAAHWTNTPANTGAQQPLYDLCHYLQNLANKRELLVKCNFEAFEDALKNGYWLSSNIPLGYGLGSSGTVVAAVYRDFCEKNDKKNGEKSGKTETEDFAMLKNKLAQMECFFHGASSGIDPLICYTKQALVIHADKTIEIAAAHTSLDGFWLIDTQKPRKTEPLVAHFKQLCLDKDYLHELTNAYIPLNELCIAAYLKRNSDLLHQSIFELSALQLVFFKNMIPDFLLTYWNEGLTSQKFCLKICGAGGGGFMLAFAKNKTDLPLFLQERVVH